MVAGAECLKWFVDDHSWSTVVRELLMLMEGRKTVLVGCEGMARGVESGGSYNCGHYS